MKQILVLLYLSIGSVAFGQVFSGRVIDALTAQPIPQAGVYIVNLQVGTFTDSSGNFQFSMNLPRQIELRVKASLYEVELKSVTTTDTVVISLKPSHIDLGDVVVSTPRGGLNEQNVFKVNRMELKELNLIQSSNLSEAMANINGVQVASLGAGISKPVVRGMQGLRVLTLVNGVRINNQQWGGDHGLGISELGISTVELIKGPSSLLYGSDAFGGVIYLIDAPYPPQGNQSFTFNSTVESVNLSSKNSLIYGASKGNFRFSGGLLHGTYADYQLPNGLYLKNSRYNQIGGKMALSYNKKNWITHARYSFSELETGLPGHTHDSIVNPLSFQSNQQVRAKTSPRQINKLHLASWENKFFFGQNELQLLFSYSKNELFEYEKITIPALGMLLDNYSANLRFTQQLSPKIKLVYGYQGVYQINTNDHKAEEQLITNFNQLDNGLYSILYTNIGKTDIQVGGRIDHRKLNAQDNQLNIDYFAPNFALGFVRKFKRNLLRMNLSTGYRAPHVSELVSNGAHNAALRYEIGNRQLQPEYSTQIDLDYEFEGDHLSVVINPYYNQIYQYISIEAQDSTVDGIPVYKYVSIDRALLYGVDVGFHYHPHFAHFLHFESTFSYVRGHADSGSSLDLIPQPRINTLIKFEFSGKLSKYLKNCAIQHEYFFAQNKVSTFEAPSEDYHLVNIGLNGKISKKRSLEWSVGAKNILNATYINHLSRLKNINTPHPGRNLYISITYNF